VALPDEESVRAREIGKMLVSASLKVSCISTWPELKPLEV